MFVISLSATEKIVYNGKLCNVSTADWSRQPS